MCGGTEYHRTILPNHRGLSPRVRGNPNEQANKPYGARSIPACAGEPGWSGRRRRLPGVYPRVCGGTTRNTRASGASRGLSPRVRGNLPGRAASLCCEGSIPACAGEPGMSVAQSAGHTVYPRVCGGTLIGSMPVSVPEGLSPRVRGNLRPIKSGMRSLRSIPACAGEPLTGSG